MTTCKCPKCGSHWNEGPTRDYLETACRKCLSTELESEQARFEAMASLMRFAPGFGWELRIFIKHDGAEMDAADLRRWLNSYMAAEAMDAETHELEQE